MKYIFSSLIILMMITNFLLANDQYIISQQRYCKIMPLYQSWDIKSGTKFSEISVPFLVYFSFGRNLSLNLQTSQATANGDVIQELAGFTDTQLSFSYYLESWHLVINLGLNLPSGKKELNKQEFQTSALLSSNYFNFHVPNFGQGLNLSPGLTWAFPLNDNVVVGLGASYQYKGKYKPLKGMSDKYKPGDEILMTGGVDLRLSETTTFAADVIYNAFGSDKVGSQKVFISGSKIGVNLKLQTYFNYNELLIFAQYRSKGKNSYVIGGVLQNEIEKTTPDQFELMVYYRMRLHPKFYLSMMGEGRSYFPTASFGGLDIFGFGFAPELLLSSNVTIPVKLKYLFGDFSGESDITGWELGFGINVLF